MGNNDPGLNWQLHGEGSAGKEGRERRGVLWIQ